MFRSFLRRFKHTVTYVNTGYELNICESMAKYTYVVKIYNALQRELTASIIYIKTFYRRCLTCRSELYFINTIKNE